MKINTAHWRRRVPAFTRFPVVLLSLVASIQIAAANGSDSVLQRNLLLAPTAPGFVLLGVEPATVERPGSVSDLAVSVANAESNLTALPSNYALQVAPFWMTQTARSLTYDKYASDNGVGASCLQTLSFSIATGTGAKSPGTALGIGARFSPWRGEVDTVFRGYADSMRLISSLQHDFANKLLSLIVDSINKDTTMQRLNAIPDKDKDAAWYEQFHPKDSAIKAEVRKEAVCDTQSTVLAHIKSIATSMPLQRFGWKLDVAGGFVLNFPSSVYDSAEFGKSGVWLTGGYEDRDWSLIGTARLLTGPTPTDTTSLDFGARLTLPVSTKAVPSLELLYRASPAPTPFVAQRLRYDLVFDVPVGSSKAISVTLGRDFGSSQNAKILLLLNLLMGFGTNRPAI